MKKLFLWLHSLSIMVLSIGTKNNLSKFLALLLTENKPGLSVFVK